MLAHASNVRFSNRPFGVKRIQTVHGSMLMSTRALASLRNRRQALPLWDSMTRRSNLSGGLAVRQSQADMRTHLIARPARDIVAFLGGSRLTSIASIFCPSCCCGFPGPAELGTVNPDGCRITASRRARATIAFFIPRRLAICVAQALSQDHFFECNMLCAPS